MIVWTQQELSFLGDLERNGVAYCNCEGWLRREYGFAYDWMVEQMRLRLGEPPMGEISLPLWCWVQYNDHKSPKPKFRPNLGDNGQPVPSVFIEADVPEEVLLQSNFRLWAWHCMNGWPIGSQELEREVDSFKRERGIQQGVEFCELPAHLQGRIRQSWECIFDLDYRHRRYDNHPRRNKAIQATFWYLRKEWIRSVRIFNPTNKM